MRYTMFLAALALLPTCGAKAQMVERRTIGAATFENVPAIPPEIVSGLARYQESRSASFADWTNDGGMLILTRFAATAQLHRVAGPAMARTQLTFAAEPIGFARIVPGSSDIVFARDTGGDEWFQFYRLGTDGRTTQLTESNTQNGSPVFARDGSRLYWSQAIKGSGDRSIWGIDPRDPASRKIIYQGKGAFSVSDISSDGRILLLSLGVSNADQRLYTLDIASGTATEFATGTPARMQDARFARGDKSVLVVSDRGSDVARLVQIDIASGRASPVSAEGRWDVEGFDLSEDGRLLAYSINEDGYSRVVVQDAITRRALPQPTLPKGVLGGLQFSRDGARLAIGLATPTAPGDVWSWDVTGGTLSRWTQSEIGPIDRAALPEPRLVRFNSFDGLSVPAFVYRPKNAAAGAKTPVLISIHGGPEAQARPGWSPATAAAADLLGATVIVPNVRGSDGYGRRYLDMDNAAKREDSVRDIGVLIDWIATQPDLDKSRVVVTGGSYGGYMSLAVMTKYSDRLAGGIDRFGIGDWTTFLQNTEAYRRDNRRAEYGDERTPEMQAVFARISPRANVAGITKPMLIEQGANDPRVPRSESEQMVQAIRARGVPVSYLLFADEGHGWRKKPNQDLAAQVEMAFLRELFGQPAK